MARVVYALGVDIVFADIFLPPLHIAPYATYVPFHPHLQPVCP